MTRAPKRRPPGMTATSEYRAWQTMRLRCLDPNHRAWPNYGGRGITVCDRWKDSPENFLADMGRKPSPKHELDRIDNNRGYEPGNCRWATRSQNDRNRRNNRFVTARGHRLTVAEWAERTGLRPDTIVKRLNAGWPDELAVATPLMRRGPQRSTRLSVERDSENFIHVVGLQEGYRVEIVLSREEARRLALAIATEVGHE